MRAVAEAAGVSLGAVANFLSGGTPTRATVARIRPALERLKREEEQRAVEIREALEGVRRLAAIRGLRGAAREVGVSPSVLSRALSGRRPPSSALLATLAEHRKPSADD